MRRVTSYSFLSFALCLSLAGLIGCNSFSAGLNPTEPTITSFTANPTAISAGGTSSLTGVFANGTGVITPGNISATSGTAVRVTPAATTTYTLTLTSSAGVTVSKTASITILTSQTITFANPGAQTVGTPFALVATASSGLTVSFASTTPSVCTVSGTTATFIATGTCTIQATQAGNATYAAATPVSQSFTVNAPGLTQQTITFANPGPQIVGTPLTLVATASSGLTVSFASTTQTVCTVSGTTATFLTAGTCTIIASQPGNATYAAATPVSQSFSVTGTASGNTVAYSSCPAPAGSGLTYTIGLLDGSGQPSGPQTIAGFTQWNNLNPGDVVCIYGKSTPYAERLVLTRSGSDDQHRIRIVGVIQGVYEPILTGMSATTADAFNYGANISGNYEGGEVSVTGLTYGTPVAYLNIEGLTIQGATTAEVGGTVASPTFSNNTYSDPNINGGAQSPWGCGSAGINLLRSDHISIIHNRIRGNDNGIFVNSNNGNTSSNVLVEYNHIYGNGVAGGSTSSCTFDAHGTYTEAENITYLGNRFGALRQGQAVNLLKDRSSGLVVAYNLFLPDGVLEASLGDALLVGSKPGPIGHLLDLVESYDTSVGPPGGLQSLGAAYDNASVYGNIFFDDGAAANGSQGAENAVHFGGDQGNSAVYRHHLHYYNNTVVARRADGVGWLEMEPTTDAGAWNNIFYAAYVGSSTPPSFNLLSTWCYDKQYGYTCGTVNYLSQNWNSPIWATTGVNGTNSTPSFVDLANDDVHIATNDATIVGNGQTGDTTYPANSTTIPIEYSDFLSTITRPYSQTKIDLGALGYSGVALLSQTITFANPGAQTVGTPLTLVATASSGLTVSFNSQTTSVCTVSGTAANFLAAGTCTIQATQAGNATYAAATPVSQSFTVNAAPTVLVTSITLPSAATVAVGAATTITATVLPANATDKTLTWNSSDTTVATVSATGVVIGIQQGTVTVMAAATDGSGVVSNDCTVTVTTASSAQSNYFGINIGTDLDWDTNRMFADAMKSSRAWGTTSDAGATLPTSALDANGWPTQDGSLYVWAGIDRMQGTYALSFNGQATVTPSSGTLAGKIYDSSTNQTIATLTYTSSVSDYLTLKFTNTKRTSSSSTNSGITNVVLMRPDAVGSTTSLPSTRIFNPPFLAALSDFAALRTMDLSATNGNEIAHWSDRTRPGDASQAIGNPGAPTGGWEGPGAAWEYAVLLANTTGKDLWINVPLNADDDYITKLAQLTKYGSDGATPYTSAQTSPVWPGLNSNLHLYVEFSNEVWNTASAFAGTENHTEAVAEVGAGGSPLNFDGDANDWNWAWRRPAEKTVQISTIFRSVWGDAAMMNTVRPVLESQLTYPNGPLLQEMHLMVDYYDNPAKVSSPHPPNYYIYGLGGSAYYGPTDLSSVNSIFSTMATGFVSYVQEDVDWALPFGVRRIAYEGGPSLDRTSDSTKDANQAAAWADPRMEQVIVTEQNAWSQANGDLLVYFYLAGAGSNSAAADYQWAFMSDVLSPSSPKMSGIADILTSPRSASTYGTPIPATLTASNANVPPAWLWSDDSNTKMHDRKWTGFSVLVSTQGVFTISLTADSATSGAEAEILVDGDSIGTVTVKSGNSTALSTPTLLVGSHGILVRNLTGTFNLTKVVVQTE